MSSTGMVPYHTPLHTAGKEHGLLVCAVYCSYGTYSTFPFGVVFVSFFVCFYFSSVKNQHLLVIRRPEEKPCRDMICMTPCCHGTLFVLSCITFTKKTIGLGFGLSVRAWIGASA